MVEKYFKTQINSNYEPRYVPYQSAKMTLGWLGPITENADLPAIMREYFLDLSVECKQVSYVNRL